jgi:uncharacterized protein (DUF433 family)
VDRNVMGGSPYVVGSRVPVRRLWAFYRNGASVDTLLKRYPQLGAAKIFDALAFAWDNPEVVEADLAREAELFRGQPRRASGGKQPEQIELPFDGEQGSDRPR